MPVQVCSLIRNEPQTIPAGDSYHVVRFRFDAGENSDRHRMHETEQPDGVSTTFAHDRAGLISGHRWLDGGS
jgi:YD repeat-containing protein